MQLSKTFITLFIAAGSVAALPGSPVQERQATPTAYVQFFNGGGCQGPWVEDDVFAQDTTACQNTGITTTYGSFTVTSDTTRQLRLFSLPNCNATGRYITLNPGQSGCFAQQVESAEFI